MASGGSGRLKSYKPLFKDIAVTRREREEAGVELRRRKRNEEVGACSFQTFVYFDSLPLYCNASTHTALVVSRRVVHASV